MSFSIKRRRYHDDTHHLPKLIPTGSFDKVLFVGGKNLTLFQSIALLITGLAVALAVGVPIIVNELYFESKFARFGYHRSISQLLVATAMILWGVVMIFNGLLGVARRILAKTQGQ